ncbi:MAG: U32 family peptidase [Lachnospiraceae bacterium]|nr:U32 family peptidase [Lachnospiraceae bacterium]
MNDIANPLPELLAPAGSFEALEAALSAGADAVYLGGKLFNARMNAANFSDEEMKKAVRLAHSVGVKLYVTLNTSLLDHELNEALHYAAFLYETGCDAVILTDLGLASLLRSYVPDLELHASTQLSGHNSAAASFLAERGFSRMVAARELPREELYALCARSPIEIECFIHGAHCVSHSGQCLLSYVQGGRSGNRGECAQPCRMKYGSGYPLSLRDLTLSAHIPDLLACGVKSLKIEGRMKSPDYVAGVVKIWRRLLDERRNADPDETEKLNRLFSRSGFTDGYFTKNIGPAMLGVRTDADKTASKEVRPHVPRTVRPRLPAIVRERPPVSLPDLPVGRGEKAVYRPDNALIWLDPAKMPERAAEGTEKGALRRDVDYLPLECWTPKANGVLLPPVIYDTELDAVAEKLAACRKAGAEHALVGNIGHIRLALEAGLTVHGSHRFNLMNTPACRMLLDAGLCDLTLSPELTLPQIRDIVKYVPTAVFAYGRLPVMTLEKPLGLRALTDRTGACFPVFREGGRDILCNSLPTSMLGAKQKKRLREIGVLRRQFLFTDETPEAVRIILSGGEPEGQYRRIRE